MNTRCWGLAVSAVLAVSGVAGGAPLPLKGSVAPAGALAPLLDLTNGTYRVKRAAAAVTVDGKASEWEGVPAMVLDRKEQSRGWDGPADLGGSLRLQWNGDGLHFFLEVVDNVHFAPRADNGWWENDCCQFAIDPFMNGPVKGFDPDEHSYLVGDSPKGPVFASYRTPGTGHEREQLFPDVRVAMDVRPDGSRAYEWTLPWAKLAPVSPWMLGRCGFSFTLNDNDGKGFKGALFWTRGIIWGQDASSFGQLVFEGADAPAAWAVGLRPEMRITGTETTSQWLRVDGAAPWNTARLVVSSPRARTVEARASIWREGGKKPVATGILKGDLKPGEPSVFAWDVSALPNGSYRLEYELPGTGIAIPYSLPFYQLNIGDLREQCAALRERFGIDRPWDPMTNAPRIVLRHRGMVADALELMSESSWTQAVNNKDQREEHLTALANAAEMVAALAEGRDFLGERRGVFWSAYYCPADGSGQRFVVALPADYKPGRTYPLFIHLHGAGGVPTPAATTQRAAVPYIEVLPWGRGARSGYTGFAEFDVLDVLATMKTWYRIDEDRVYLTGASMGGGGTWRIGSRHPDLFAAAGPVCGYTDGLPLENLRNVPVFNQHGDEDWSVPIDMSRYGVSRLQQLGYPVLHKELLKSGHSPVGAYPHRDWMLGLTRPAAPADITFTCARPDPPFNGAYGVRIAEFEDPHRTARFDVSRVAGAVPQTLALRADNVAILELDTARLALDRKRPLLLQAGFEFLQQEAPLPDRLVLHRSDGHWRITNAVPNNENRPYRSGGAANLVCNEPALIVYGTAGGEARTVLLREAAVKLSKTAGVRGGTVSGGIPVKADRDLSESDLQRYNLFVLGGRADNTLLPKLLPGLPVRFTDGNTLEAGGRKPVPLAGAGWRMVHYNPLAPSRLVCLAGTDETNDAAAAWYGKGAELLGGWETVSSPDAPDLAVVTLDGVKRRCLQFTHGWQWAAPAAEERPLPAAMADATAFAKAELEAMRTCAGAEFGLTWGREKAPREFDPEWFTLADLATEGSPREILVADMAGGDLTAIHAGLGAKGEVLMVPDPAGLESNRLYRVAMPPDLCWRVCNDRQKNLLNTRYSEPCPARAVWERVLAAGR